MPATAAATEPAQTLTAQQIKVLRYLVSYWGDHQVYPTIREIADHMGYSGGSPNGPICHLRALVKKGFIRMGRKEARSIEVVALTESVASIAANYLKTLKG